MKGQGWPLWRRSLAGGGTMAGRAVGASAGRGHNGTWSRPWLGVVITGRGQPGAQAALPTENQIWICKPTASNQGKGIFLLKSQEEVAALQVKTQSIEDDPIYRKMPFRAPQARVVQRCWAWAPQGASVTVGLTLDPTGVWESWRGVTRP